MTKTLVLYLLLLTSIAGAQVLLPTALTAFEPQHSFNPEIIRLRDIRRITFEIIDKKDFEIAEDKNLTETYEFNQEGLVSRYYYTVIARTIQKEITGRHGTSTTTEYVYDTVSTSFFYDGQNRVILRRYHDGGNYYESRYYRYNSDGQMTRELRYRETNVSPVKSFFILGNQVLLSEDSFQYQNYSAKQYKCIVLNNEKRPYKERVINLDSIGRQKSANEYYTAASWLFQNYNYRYDGKRLVEAVYKANSGIETVMKNLYEYQEGELYSEKQYRDNELLREISYVADRTNGLLNSFVLRDPVARTMRIVRLRYEFGLLTKGGK